VQCFICFKQSESFTFCLLPNSHLIAQIHTHTHTCNLHGQVVYYRSDLAGTHNASQQTVPAKKKPVPAMTRTCTAPVASPLHFRS